MNAVRALLREGLDWLVILVVGCVSVPGFLMLLLRGMKWPLVLGGLTFAAYAWRVVNLPESRRVKNPWDLRWHVLMLCMCCVVWVLLIGLLPVPLVAWLNARLPSWLADPASAQHAVQLANHLTDLTEGVLTVVMIGLFSKYAPFLLGLALLGWVSYRSIFRRWEQIDDLTKALRWPVLGVLALYLASQLDVGGVSAALEAWLMQYLNELTVLVSMACLGFLPLRIWQIVFRPVPRPEGGPGDERGGAAGASASDYAGMSLITPRRGTGRAARKP